MGPCNAINNKQCDNIMSRLEEFNKKDKFWQSDKTFIMRFSTIEAGTWMKRLLNQGL